MTRLGLGASKDFLQDGDAVIAVPRLIDEELDCIFIGASVLDISVCIAFIQPLALHNVAFAAWE